MSPEAEAANARSRRLQAERCEHYIPAPLTGRASDVWTCKAGVIMDTVRRRRMPGESILADFPCYGEGRAAGATCDRCLLPTPEQLAERHASTQRLIRSLETNTCGDCGATLIRRGTAFACPNGHVSGFACGAKDIREDGR